jgi:hypothetical protein
MTWTAHCRVESVITHPDHTEVVLAAEAAEMVRPFPNAPDHEVPAIVSNTEGPITSVRVSIRIEGRHELDTERHVTLSGHFDTDPD